MTSVAAVPPRQRRRTKPGRNPRRRLSPAEIAGMALMATLVVVAIIAPAFAADPTIAVGEPFLQPTLDHILGTDDVGQDVLSRVLYGLRSSIVVAVVVVFLGALIGSLVGVAAGVLGGWLDAILMRTTDVFITIPAPIFAVALITALGPGLRNTVIAVVVVWWPWYARLMRNETRAIMVRPHIDAARLAGASGPRVAFRHVLPGTLAPLVITASLDLQVVVLTLAGLSFLGLGSPPPAPELGAMAANATDYLIGNPLLSLAPSAAVLLLALAANYSGDGVRTLLSDKTSR